MNIQISSRFSRVLRGYARVPSFWELRNLCLIRPRLQLQLNDVTSRSTWVNQNTEWRWLGGQSCQVPLWSWCLHQDELLLVLVVQGVADWKGHLIICGVGCRWMSPAILGRCWSGNTSSRMRICRWCVGVVCFLAWFLTQVFRCGKGWIRLVAADLDHLRVAFPDRAAFSACSHLMKLYKNSRTPLQQRAVNVNLIETWNRFSSCRFWALFHRISSLHHLLSRNFGTLQSSSES